MDHRQRGRLAANRNRNRASCAAAKNGPGCSGAFGNDGSRPRLRTVHARTIVGAGARYRALATSLRTPEAETTLPSIAPGDGLKWASGPRVSDALSALADALDRDASGDALPLTPFDRRPAWQPFAAQPGRAEAPQVLLERALCDWFDGHTGAPHPELVAPLVEVTLKLDTVDPGDLSRRWRKFRDKA